MELYEVYLGRGTWEDFLADQALTETVEKTLRVAHTPDGDGSPEPAPASIQILLDESHYQLALESGLGAIGCLSAEPGCLLELSLETLSGGIDRLNADFNLLLGDVIWKLEMRQESLDIALSEIRLAEFEREASPFRHRAERAYLNGWYQEALNDFLEAEKRNYPDFAVHRSIASIYLYRIVDLPRAQEYFSTAARYSRPCDPRQAAEALYFAGISAAAQRQFDEGLEYLSQAVALNPRLYEADYQMACLATIAGETTSALASLESAIVGDSRYYERAGRDGAFDRIRPQVEALLGRLMETVGEKLAEVRRDAELLKHYVITRPEKQERISTIFQKLEEQGAMASTYKAGLTFMETLAEAHQELQSLRDLFFKQHEINGRDYIRSIAFSPDGRLVASGFLYEGIKVWEVDSASKVRSLKGHTSSVNSVAFSPNNLWLASASRDRSIRLWDIETGKELRSMKGHEGEVRAVTFSPDGEWLASAGHDRTVRLWRVITGREVQTFSGHTHGATSVAFSPDGELLASGSLDKTIKLWETSTGRQLASLEGHTKGVVSVAFSQDGCWIASGGEDKVVKLWDAQTGRNVKTLIGHRNDVTSIAFSPDGELLAAGSLGQTIRIWRLPTGRIIKTLWYREISWNPVAFSPKGQWLALGSRELQLRLKAVLTEDQYEQLKAGESQSLLLGYEPEMSALERAELEWGGLEESDEEVEREKKRASRQCRICGVDLTFFEKATRKQYCKQHR